MRRFPWNALHSTVCRQKRFTNISKRNVCQKQQRVKELLHGRYGQSSIDIFSKCPIIVTKLYNAEVKWFTKNLFCIFTEVVGHLVYVCLGSYSFCEIISIEFAIELRVTFSKRSFRDVQRSPTIEMFHDLLTGVDFIWFFSRWHKWKQEIHPSFSYLLFISTIIDYTTHRSAICASAATSCSSLEDRVRKEFPGGDDCSSVCLQEALITWQQDELNEADGTTIEGETTTIVDNNIGSSNCTLKDNPHSQWLDQSSKNKRYLPSNTWDQLISRLVSRRSNFQCLVSQRQEHDNQVVSKSAK